MNRFLAFSLMLLSLSAYADTTLRVASFNIAMGLEEAGQLSRRLHRNDDEGLKALAAVLQEVRPDVVLLNEVDYDPSVDATNLLNEHYLNSSQHGGEPISYGYSFRAPVNTGIDSGLDLDNDGVLHEPEDARGYGAFPGQYGMLVLSRYPIDTSNVRTFQNFPWADMPEASRPHNEDGTPYWSDEVWKQIPLSSKSHWDVPIEVSPGHRLHLLASHPTPPVFDGPEDRNGHRNRDELQFWSHYLFDPKADFIRDDAGHSGGLTPGVAWVIAGDLNADPADGDSRRGPIARFAAYAEQKGRCVPSSQGAVIAAQAQGGANAQHTGNPAFDTADFSDRYTGNLRADYLIPSQVLNVTACGVFWPEPGSRGSEWMEFTDHRLVWMDLAF